MPIWAIINIEHFLYELYYSWLHDCIWVYFVSVQQNGTDKPFQQISVYMGPVEQFQTKSQALLLIAVRKFLSEFLLLLP